MKYKYDSETDILMILLGSDKPDFAEQRENIITHYTKQGVPVQIEILDASATLQYLVKLVSKKKKTVEN